MQVNIHNWKELVIDKACPDCGAIGVFQTFRNPNNNGIGIECCNCGRKHPFGCRWISQQDNNKPKRSNDLQATMKDRGFYCYGCGTSYDLLNKSGIGMHVHHTKPFCKNGDDVPKIPLCSACHELITANQRLLGRLLGNDADRG